MRYRYLALAGAFFFAPSVAFAQTASPAEKPAVSTSDSSNPAAPVKGKNSFTEDQAKARFEEAGYADVTSLTLNEDGVWEGSATKDGNKVTVQLDYQGNITNKAM